jgi:uncharacterized protein (DUF2235 family)
MAQATETSYVPRQLVICCDGTNNTLTAGTEDTNVLRLHTHLVRHPSARRVLYYDPGVGTPDALPPTDPVDWVQRTWERLSGLASGRGVYDNIEQAYLFLMRNWRDERDQIYAFGFSRGAFTARCVVGMVNLFGILAPEHEALLPTLIRVYFSVPSGKGTALQRATRAVHRALARRSKAAAEVAGHNLMGTRVTREELAAQIRELFTSPAGREAWVHWVGVWDTVESVGLPGPLSRSNPSTATLRGKRVRNVRHALAFDEHRWTFVPRLYEEPGDVADGGQTLKQRWFPGVHCDVGGSYPMQQAGLSDEALDWMVSEAAADLDVPALAPSTAARVRHDALWDTPWWALAGMCLRDMHPRTSGDHQQQIAVMAGSAAPTPELSVWIKRRPLWPVWTALIAGFACLVLSGANLLVGGWRRLADADSIVAAVRAARHFATEQLTALWGSGVLADGGAPWLRGVQPGWAMFWDLAFVACWGYLLARIASRAFTWLAGMRSPASTLPAWRLLGMAPLAAVGGDIAEDVLTLAALAAHGAGTDLAAALLMWCAALGSIAKIAGLSASVVLLGVRVWIALPGVPTAGAAARSTAT